MVFIRGITSHPSYKNFVLEICNPNRHDEI
jgi:hypothetical protein